MDIPELGHSAARARQESPKAIPDEDDMSPLSPLPDVIHADTAFLVYKTPDGQVILTADLNTPVSVRRGPLNHDIVGMSHCVLEDIRLMGSAPAIAQTVVNAVKLEQQQQMEQMQQAQVLQQIQKQKQGHL